MEISNLEKGQVLRIWCLSNKSTFIKGYTKSTLITWVNSIVCLGEVIRFTDYTNYEDDWLVIDIDKIDTYDNCKAKFGGDYWLHHIEGYEEGNQDENDLEAHQISIPWQETAERRNG